MKLVVGLIVSACCASAVAQYPFASKAIFSPEAHAGWAFGQAFTAADMNGDGFCDLVAAEGGATVDGVVTAGRAWIIYGPDLASFVKIESRSPVAAEFMGDYGCAVGDVNGDGIGDVLLSARYYSGGSYIEEGRAHLFLGPSYDEHIVFNDPLPEAFSQFSAQGVKLADFDGDGQDDVYIGGWLHSGRAPDGTLLDQAGEAFVWDAQAVLTTGGPGAPSKIADLYPKKDGLFGQLPYVADFDGDGLPDLFLGHFGFAVYPGCAAGAGLVQVIHGASLMEAAALCPPAIPALDTYGVVTYFGDIDNDGEPEIVAPFGSYDGLCAGSGTVLILGGQDFQTIEKQIFSPDVCQGSSGFGSYSHVSDVDQDGILDLIASDGSVDGTRVNVLYGPDYVVIQSFGPEQPFGVWSTGWGAQLTSGDFDGDGFAELAWYTGQGNYEGSIYIYDLQTLTADSTSISVPAGGDVDFNLYCGLGEAGHAYVGLLGISGTSPGVIPDKGVFVPLNVDEVTWAGLTLLGSPLLEGFAGTLDATGRASMTLHLPPGFPSPLIGHELSVAAVTIQPDGRLGMGTSAVDVDLTP